MDNPQQFDHILVFTPDDETRRRYQAAFGRLRIYPGYAGPVVLTTGNLIRIGDALKAWPSSQYRELDTFVPGELAAYRVAFERSAYSGRGPVTLHVGDRVRFQPSELCDLLHHTVYSEAGLFPTYTGVVTSVASDGFVDVDGRGVWLHWSEFVAIEPGASSDLGSKEGG